MRSVSRPRQKPLTWSHASSQKEEEEFSVLDLLLIGGLLLLFLPWAVRMVTQWTGALAGLKVMHLNVAGAAILITFAGVSWLTGRLHLGMLRPGFRLWYGYLCVWGVWMAAWGYIQGPPPIVLLEELCAMSLFLVGVAVGTSTRNWKRIDQVFPIGLGLIGIPVVIAGIKVVGSFSPDDLKKGLVYSASAILATSTFFVLAPQRVHSQWKRNLASAAFFLYGACQFLFAKRAPLIRVLFVFLLGYWVIPGWTGGKRFGRRVVGILLLGIAVTLGATMAGGRGWESLEVRFEKLIAFSSIVVAPEESDLWEDPSADNETFRLKEVGYFFDGMSPLQRLVGAGLGSYTRDYRVAGNWTVRTGDSGPVVGGKTTTHIGMFWAFFKGGAVYFIVFHLGVLAVLFQLKHFKGNLFKLNAWGFILTYLLFSMAEGFWMSSGAELTTFLMGASIGALISQE